MKKIIIIALVAAIAALLYFTCPTASDHKEKISTVVSEYVQDEISEKSGTSVVGHLVGGLLGATAVKAAVNSLIEVHNYGLVSVGTLTWDGKTRVVSVGAAGHVFTFDKQKLSESLEEAE